MIVKKERIIGEKKINLNGETTYTAEYYSNGGSSGYIYKNFDAFYHSEQYPEDELVYIPEYGFPEKSGMADIVETEVTGYTKRALIEMAGSTLAADSLFDILSWQFPETLWDELCDDSDENGHWIEAQMTYEKVYVPQFNADPDRKGQAPVCYDEFYNVEWQDKDSRQVYLERLVELGVVNKETADEAMDDFQEYETMLCSEME